MNKRNSRDLFPGHGAGKGDADRSPGWRDHYDEIDWQRKSNLILDPATATVREDFVRVSPRRVRKVYR